MQNNEVLSAEQINDFVQGTARVSILPQNKEEVYAWGRECAGGSAVYAAP